MSLLLTGKTGQLGWELFQHLRREHDVLAIEREEIDFLDTHLMKSMLKTLPDIDLIVNAAGYTDIDKAEEEPFVAETINAEAVAILAAEASRRKIPMVHFSSDQVFSGWRRTWAYREEEAPVPASLYGWTMLEGERRLRSKLKKHLIFRLSGLYGLRRKNFFTEIVERNR
jgi:dTDP-4-dehydrorhamnose reductase